VEAVRVLAVEGVDHGHDLVHPAHKAITHQLHTFGYTQRRVRWQKDRERLGGGKGGEGKGERCRRRPTFRFLCPTCSSASPRPCSPSRTARQPAGGEGGLSVAAKTAHRPCEIMCVLNDTLSHCTHVIRPALCPPRS
jgi:hypothetical protein